MSSVVEQTRQAVQATPRVYTYAELAADMPETNQPHELWDGELILSPTPSFFHQEIAFRFHRALHDWVKAICTR